MNVRLFLLATSLAPLAWSVRGRAGQFTVLQAILNVNHNADGGPDAESDPGQPWEKAHEAEAGQHAQDGNNWHEGKSERSGLIRFCVAQDHDTDTD